MEGPENYGLQRFVTLPDRERLHVEFPTDYGVAIFNSIVNFSSLLWRGPFLLQAEFLDLVVEGDPIDPERMGGPHDVPLVLVQDHLNVRLLDLLERFRPVIRVGSGGREADVGLGDDVPLGHDHRPLDDVAKLPRVPRPIVADQDSHGPLADP